MSATAVVFVSLLVLSAVITGGLASYAWRRRGEPGARPFAGLMAATTLWAVCSAGTLLVADPVMHRLIEQVQWLGIVFVPIFWLLFGLSYTGHDKFVSARTVGAVSVFPLVVFGLLWTGRWRGLVWVNTEIQVVQGMAFAIGEYGVLYWMFVLYAYTLIAIGTLLLIRLIFVSDYLFADQAALLVVGTIVPLVGNAMTQLKLVPFAELDLTPFAFAVTGPAFGYALFRRRLFELVPATRRLGRDTAIATLDDGVLILDNDYHVIYLNSEAAAVLDCDPREALGASAADLVDTEVIDSDVPDTLAELHIRERYYEAQPSTITDRRDCDIGHTLVLHDITARKRRERRLRSQRDEFERLDRLNEVIREITGTFVSATTRDEIEDAVCDRLSATGLYTEARIILDPTGEIVLGDSGDETDRTVTPRTIPVTNSDDTAPADETLLDVIDTEQGSWTAIPLGYGHTVYGVLAVSTARMDGFDSRELEVLGRFGETISHALDAVENRRLLLANTIAELEFQCPDAALTDVVGAAVCRLVFTGCVPAAGEGVLAYYHVEDGSTERVVDVATETAGIDDARAIDTEPGVVEFILKDRSPLLALIDSVANVRTAEIVERGHQVVVETTLETDVRALTEHVRTYCPEATLAAKHEHDRPVETNREPESLPATLAQLTERQSEVLEAAYRAGYFRWPRDRTAEEVADSIGISSPTLHKHLRRAEEQLFTVVFEANDDTTQPHKQK